MQKTFTVSGRSFAAHVEPKLEKFWNLLAANRWEPATFQVFEKHIRPGSTVADVGAWIGPTALFAAHIAGTVHAFEPDHTAFKALEANLALNPELARNIELHRAALTDFDGTVSMTSPGQAGMSESSTLLDHGDTTFEVPAVDAARLFADELNAVEFVKMDIEGGEYETIPAMGDFITDRKPTVLLSLHPHNLGLDLNDEQRNDYVRAKTATILHAFRGYDAAFRVTAREIIPAPDVRRFLHSGGYADPGDCLLLLP